MALVSAAATLLAALFLCLGTGPDGERAHHGAAPRATGAAPAAPAQARATVAAVTAVGEYICPYDRGGCSLYPSLSPAVLSAPPLDPPLHAEAGSGRPATASGDGAALRADARPRAPDLPVRAVLPRGPRA
ncbi:hypothetical protein ACFWWN_32110, partial [Streptomyces sp. NPDC059082]|uniref:hypothetical protein n=1 Tax=Streptomyces sp. NPDC059082 TaxID=3346720 RepID=UPI0036AE3829